MKGDDDDDKSEYQTIYAKVSRINIKCGHTYTMYCRRSLIINIHKFILCINFSIILIALCHASHVCARVLCKFLRNVYEKRIKKNFFLIASH